MKTFPALLLLTGVVWFGAASARAQTLFEGTSLRVPEPVERAYVKGIQYLVRNQSAAGTWPDDYGKQPGVIALALLAIIAHGEDPNHGPYATTLRRGTDALLKEQNNASGYIGNSMYHHGFATLALAELYGALNDERIGPALERAVQLILRSQSGNVYGAWRYTPESKDADTTVSGAVLMALFAARNAGCNVPEDSVQRALQFYRNCQSPGGGFGYTSASSPNGPRTAIGLLVLALGRERNTDAFRNALRFLRSNEQVIEPVYAQYYGYYAAQAFFQADPALWEQWSATHARSLEQSQLDDGSWPGAHGTTFGTAASLLSLALHYRYLPIYER